MRSNAVNMLKCQEIQLSGDLNKLNRKFQVCHMATILKAYFYLIYVTNIADLFVKKMLFGHVHIHLF